jgi:hypothetical protein
MKMVAGRFEIVAKSVVTGNTCEKSNKVTGTQTRSALGTSEYEEVLIIILNFTPEIFLLVSEERNGRKRLYRRVNDR